MTNKEFRQSLSKEQIRFLQDKYKDLLNQVEGSFDGIWHMYYRDGVELVGNGLLLASVYKDLLVDDSLNSLFCEYYKRYETMYENM